MNVDTKLVIFLLTLNAAAFSLGLFVGRYLENRRWERIIPQLMRYLMRHDNGNGGVDACN